MALKCAILFSMPSDLTNGTSRPNDDKSPLERAQERLYRPGEMIDITPPTLPRQQPSYIAPQPVRWTPPPPPKAPKKGFPLAVWFLIIAVLFFLAALGVAATLFILGTRSVSNNNITITVQGPASIASGTAVPLTITVTNHNPAAISNTDITLTFPDGTRSADDVTQPLVRYTNSLGTIAAGGNDTQTVQAVLFGSANQTVTIPVTFEYHTANSDALFTKEQDYTFTITSAPLAITVNTVSSIATGQPLGIAVAVRSNATTVLNNIAVVATYPPGFTPNSSANATTSNSYFNIGTLQPGQEKDFTIEGTLSGTDNTQLAFDFTVGTAATDGTPTLGVAYASQEAQVTLEKPFLATSLSLNNANTNPIIVSAGQPISGVISWVNSVSSAITNGVVTIQLSGNALNPSSVTTPDGFYNSSSQTLSFDGQSEPSLATLNAGDAGTGSFTLYTLTGNALNTLRMPTIMLTVSVAGQHSGNGTTETIHNTLTQKIELATNLVLTSSVVHKNGPFPNTGAQPPVVGQPTTYTVLWGVTNNLNAVGGATVTAIVPTYVTFTGQVTPSDGSLTYNATTHAVTWKIGNIPAGTVGASALQAAFQVSLTPSATQAQTSPILIGNQTLTGTDRFTNTQVGNTADALDIETPTDPGYNNTFGTVGN
jgi:hypothetical protein